MSAGEEPSVGLSEDEEARYGFRWGNLVVTRRSELPSGYRVLRISTDAGQRIDVYVSHAGRRIRVYQGAKEMKTP